jgi:TnpA family transposase
MPRKQILSENDKTKLFALPETQEDIHARYAFSENDLSIIRNNCRGAANRLGFAVLLSYMRFPGIVLPVNTDPDLMLLLYVSSQIGVAPSQWNNYGKREQTRREHLVSLQSIFGYRIFVHTDHQPAVDFTQTIALQTDKGILIAEGLVGELQRKNILLPSVNTIEKICAEALTNAEREIFGRLTFRLSNRQKTALDHLLKSDDERGTSILTWLKQSPSAVNSKHLLEHLSRLKTIKELDFRSGTGADIHQNRLMKIAREGRQMTAQHLMGLEQNRRFATLIAVLIDLKATVIDEIIDMHDKIMGAMFKHAKNTQTQLLQSSEKSINEQLKLYFAIGNVLLEARETGLDVYQAIESVISWEEFSQSIIETGKLTRKKQFDYMPFIAEKYTLVKRYVETFLEELDIKASPVAGDLIRAIEILRQLYRGKIRKLPEKLPAGFIRKRWEEHIFTESGVNRRFYELCVFSEIKNCLRSGDIWVKGSRQYKDFEDYMIPAGAYSELIKNGLFPLNISLDAESYLSKKIRLLSDKFKQVCELAERNEIPDASLTGTRIKVKPLETEIPEDAKELSRKVYLLLPHVKITDLLIEVDRLTGFTKHFTHLKNSEQTKDRVLLLTAILSDAINLGLRKMSEASPGMSYARLSQIQAWYIRDETYSSALADIVNHIGREAFTSYWGEGKTSSSDGQRFAAGSHAQGTGNINPKYGSDPGIQFYTHISDQYAPFHVKVINVGVRDATYVLDGLLYHESDLDIEEHYTDTSGFTDHVFALMHLLGFRFAPRIRDLKEKKLFVPAGNSNFSIISEHIGGTINTKKIIDNWSEILRLATSIKQGAVTASLIIRKIGSYPRQNALATALRELGRIERSLFILDWYLKPELRRKVTAGLNKGEARNSLARAVYFNRHGEIRDRNFENQRHRAGGLNLVTAAIILWNTLYIAKAVEHLQNNGHEINPEYLKHLSPLGWEHIHLTGDYTWDQKIKLKNGELRPLRNLDEM